MVDGVDGRTDVQQNDCSQLVVICGTKHFTKKHQASGLRRIMTTLRNQTARQINALIAVANETGGDCSVIKLRNERRL